MKSRTEMRYEVIVFNWLTISLEWWLKTFEIVYFIGLIHVRKRGKKNYLCLDIWLKVSEALCCTGKVLGFCIPVYLWRNSGRRNYPIRLKFDPNIYVLCEICSEFFVSKVSESYVLEVCMSRIFQVRARPAWLHFRPGPARSKDKNFGHCPGRSEREIEISARPGLVNFFSISARTA